MENKDKKDKKEKKVLLEISHLSQYFPVKKTKFRQEQLYVRANDDISLEIYEGETFGLVGESGCGKSTFGRTLLQLYHQTDGKTMYYGRTLDYIAPAYLEHGKKTMSQENLAKDEACRDNGIDLAKLEYSEMRLLRKDLQLIFQDPYSSLNPRMTVGQIIGEGLLAHNFFKSNDSHMQDYVMKVMEDCGLPAYMIHRYPHQFSGGQRQRIGIARALALKPKFVVCDEAVSALDVSIQSQVINLLQDLKEKENLTYLFISHDLSVVKYISDRIGVMYLGNLVEMALTADIFAKPRHPYTEALLSAIPTTDVDSKREAILLEGDIPSPIKPPTGCKFHTRCRYCTEVCTQLIPEFKEIAPNHFVACHHMVE